MNVPVEIAIARARGVKRLAHVAGVSVRTVYLWRTEGRIPLQYCALIGKKLKISLHSLRPDVFPKSGPLYTNHIKYLPERFAKS